jgi:hypothetical protein
MGNKKDKKYRYRKRIFLNEDYEMTSYVVAIVENSKQKKKLDKDSDSKGSAKLILENPYDKVVLNFELDLPDQVKESLTKIEEFESLLKRFKKAVKKEAKSRKKQSYEHIKDEIITVK